MKVEVDMDIDKMEIILNILYDLGQESILTVSDNIIERAIEQHIKDNIHDPDYCDVIIRVPSSEIESVKKDFIEYLNDLIKQLS